MATRVGGVLVLIAVAMAAIAAVSGTGWSLGSSSAGGWLTLVVLAILGMGAVLLAVRGSAPFDRRLGRWSLALLTATTAALVVSAVRAATITTDAFEDGLTMWLLLGGLAVMPFGLAGLGLDLARHRGVARWTGVILLAGTGILLVAIPFGPEVGTLVGALLVGLGLVGVGALAMSLDRRLLQHA
jgi:hypothetical protein